MPRFHDEALGEGSVLSRRRVAIVSSAGLVVRGEDPFRGRDADYRMIPADTRPEELLISHISINFDPQVFRKIGMLFFRLTDCGNSPPRV